MKTILNPLVVTAILLSVFTTVCAVELLIELDAPRSYLLAQSSLLVLLVFATWLCWRRRLRSSTGPSSWRYVVTRVLPVATVVYVISYFALMDRTIPILTGPAGVVDHQSSFRWRPPMAPTPLPMVTIWNFLYDPMDSLYFRFFPRSTNEITRLKRKGLM